MYEQINQKQFEEIMGNLFRKDVWLGVHTPCLSIYLDYPNFEFLNFTKGSYQFGHAEEHELQYQNVEINVDIITSIYRDTTLPTVNSEQIVLELTDGVQLILEHNC